MRDRNAVEREALEAFDHSMRGIHWSILVVMIMIAFACLVAMTLIWPPNADAETIAKKDMPKFSQPGIPCMPRQMAIGELMGPRYHELPLFTARLAGAQGVAGIVVVLANATTRSWSMLLLPDDKSACVLMAGDHFDPADLDKLIGPQL